ncbi:MAG: HD domain-containing phosphohydrolase [Chloroflexota bacterium]
MQLSKTLLRELFEFAPDAILVVDHAGQIVNCNALAETLFGYQRDELIGMVVENLIPERFREQHTRLHEAYLAAPRRRRMGKLKTLWGLHKDHREIPLDIMLGVLNDSGMVVVTIRDISERQQILEQLRASQLSHEEAQRIAHLGHWELDLVKNELKWSSEIFRIFEIAPQEFGETYEMFLETVHPEDREMVDRAYTDSVKSKIPYDIIHRLLMKDGRMKYVNERCETFYADDGTPLRSVGTVLDITERSQAQKQSEEQLRRLEALREIDVAIVNTTNLSLALKTILDQVTISLDVDAADILLLNPHSLILEYAAGRGFRTHGIEKTQLRLGQGHAGRAALEQKTIITPDLANLREPFLRASLIEGEDFVSFCAEPLIAKGNLVGVLEVFHRELLQTDQNWLDFLHTIGGQASIAIDSGRLFQNLQRSNMDLMLAYDMTIEGWSKALDLRDEETEGHTLRVTEMTLTLARMAGISESEIVHVRRGALLHDIGKMGIPDSILLKPDKLTDDEWAIMRKHPVYAYEWLYPIEYLRPSLAIPYSHHEKWDGTGYPQGLKGEQIPLPARLFAVVDVWDALSSDRLYRKAWRQEEVLEYIQQQSGAHFDPEAVKLFLRVISKKESG